eukprot:1192011-Prorocentrum_minimum.AAC.2
MPPPPPEQLHAREGRAVQLGLHPPLRAALCGRAHLPYHPRPLVPPLRLHTGNESLKRPFTTGEFNSPPNF